MFLGYLHNLSSEMSLYPTSLKTGLQFLLQKSTEDIPVGRYTIDADKIFAIVSEYYTEAKENRRPEIHKKYIDIQYICSGSEVIGVAPLSCVGAVSENKILVKDTIYYETVDTETDIILTAGMFGVYFPWDVHRPNCSVGLEAQKVKKIVVKVAID